MYNFAVIGRNFITDWFLQAASEVDEVSFYGVYSRSVDDAKEYALKNGAKKAFSSIDDMCRDENIDFVYIASPNICHAPQTAELLSAGKHVLCEKPAAISAAEFDKALASSKGNAVFAEGMVPLHMPGFQKIKELIPSLGTIRHIDFNFCQYSSRYDRFKKGIMTNTFDPTLGNGALTDLGIYCIETLVALFGMPSDMVGTAIFSGIDTADSLICAYPDKIAKINVSKISDGALPSQIQGENGCILIDKISRPKVITLRPKGGEPVVFDTTSEKHDMTFELENFVASMKKGQNDYYNEITRLSMHFCDIAREKLGIDFKRR